MGRDKRLEAYIRSREKVQLEELLREETGNDRHGEHDALRQLLALDEDDQRREPAKMSPDFS
jgi:hypothetical protein